MAVPGYSFTSRCVALKTPPVELPTSWPKTKKPGSRLTISTSASLTASIIGILRVGPDGGCGAADGISMTRSMTRSDWHRRLGDHLVFGGVDPRLDLVVDAFDIRRRDQAALDQHLGHALYRVFGAGRLLDLFAGAIAADVGAAGVRVEQAAMQVHEGGPLAIAQPRGQLAGRLVDLQRVDGVHIHGDGVHRAHLRRQVASPLRLLLGHDGPVIVPDRDEHRQFVDGRLAEQHVEVVGRGAAVATGEERRRGGYRPA